MEFWEKWRFIEHTNQVFSDHADHLHHVTPCMFHGDEGVGHRRKPVLQIVFGSLLRVGKSSLERMLLITSCPHKMQGFSSAKHCVGQAYGGVWEICVESPYPWHRNTWPHILYFVFVRLAADHPFQTKAYRSTRGHLKTNICPHCHANTYSVPFEEMHLDAMWRTTILQFLPWSRDVAIPLALMPGANHPSFIQWDLMHRLPHGCARSFVACIICMLAGPLDVFLPCGVGGASRNSKEHRLDEAS